jgi:hypothetical protein
MKPSEVYEVLKQKGIDSVFHANSVTTSLTFLRQRAFVSRGFAEAKGLPQTPQYSDAQDKQVGVWNDVFVDTDDYHHRIRRLNQYGPVVFGIRSEILAELPKDSDVLVTKSNPTKWAHGQTTADRYYQSREELTGELTRGTFDQMITIRTPGAVLPFDRHLVSLVVDDPGQLLDTGRDACTASIALLDQASMEAGLSIRASKRVCRSECRCLGEYGARWTGKLRSYF